MGDCENCPVLLKARQATSNMRRQLTSLREQNAELRRKNERIFVVIAGNLCEYMEVK